MDLSTEESRLAAPTNLKIDIASNIAGVLVRLSHGPSADDPLGQRATVRHYLTSSEAFDALPELVRGYLHEHHDRAAARVAGDRERAGREL